LIAWRLNSVRIFSITRAGAASNGWGKLDGILRNHQVAANGTLRDTVVYSIIAAEWPT